MAVDNIARALAAKAIAGGGDIEIAQEPGDSETAVMSQKAVTEAISNAITNTLNTEV